MVIPNYLHLIFNNVIQIYLSTTLTIIIYHNSELYLYGFMAF